MENHTNSREIFLRHFRDMEEKTSFWRYASDVLKTSKDIFFQMFLRRIKDVAQKTYLYLRRLKISQKSHLFWDASKRSLRCLSQWRPDWDFSEISHIGSNPWTTCWFEVPWIFRIEKIFVIVVWSKV